ncbi:hypothetical protein H2248_007553 [Termitomyces sp. 'cryptogamus']|nr:hypothetical protein H2248_007553 [Termitomyces sp. 'cryptogamus']
MASSSQVHVPETYPDEIPSSPKEFSDSDLDATNYDYEDGSEECTPAPLPVLPNPPPNSPNPCPPSAPTPGNSNTSLANPDGPLINSDAFSAAVDASPEFP